MLRRLDVLFRDSILVGTFVICEPLQLQDTRTYALTMITTQEIWMLDLTNGLKYEACTRHATKMPP